MQLNSTGTYLIHIRNPFTGALIAPTSISAALFINGVNTGAVTLTPVSTGIYSYTVTPTVYSVHQVVVTITLTISSVVYTFVETALREVPVPPPVDLSSITSSLASIVIEQSDLASSYFSLASSYTSIASSYTSLASSYTSLSTLPEAVNDLSLDFQLFTDTGIVTKLSEFNTLLIAPQFVELSTLLGESSVSNNSQSFSFETFEFESTITPGVEFNLSLTVVDPSITALSTVSLSIKDATGEEYGPWSGSVTVSSSKTINLSIPAEDTATLPRGWQSVTFTVGGIIVGRNLEILVN